MNMKLSSVAYEKILNSRMAISNSRKHEMKFMDLE